jgi:hypothetical protein
MADDPAKTEAKTKESSPTDQEVLDQSVKPFYYGKPQYRSDEDRRRELAAEQGEAEKFIVTDANPATGGVYPPSAVVDPYSPEVVAEHTPGEPEPDTEPEPASETTPAEKT